MVLILVKIVWDSNRRGKGLSIWRKGDFSGFEGCRTAAEAATEPSKSGFGRRNLGWSKNIQRNVLGI